MFLWRALTFVRFSNKPLFRSDYNGPAVYQRNASSSKIKIHFRTLPDDMWQRIRPNGRWSFFNSISPVAAETNWSIKSELRSDVSSHFSWLLYFKFVIVFEKWQHKFGFQTTYNLGSYRLYISNNWNSLENIKYHRRYHHA